MDNAMRTTRALLARPVVRNTDSVDRVPRAVLVSECECSQQWGSGETRVRARSREPHLTLPVDNVDGDRNSWSWGSGSYGNGECGANAKANGEGGAKQKGWTGTPTSPAKKSSRGRFALLLILRSKINK